ncbi:MAG: toll/interleukin-1 receptor domain-containing protein [Rhodomicrobium sp.]
MADVFISYSKRHARLTEDLARDLEARGFTTWWDTSLLPDDLHFPEKIRDQIRAAKAVIVIWAAHSVGSRWVYSEASEGHEQGKLFQVRDEWLDPRQIPLPFKTDNVPPISEREKLYAALERNGIKPSRRPVEPEEPTRVDKLRGENTSNTTMFLAGVAIAALIAVAVWYFALRESPPSPLMLQRPGADPCQAHPRPVFCDL